MAWNPFMFELEFAFTTVAVIFCALIYMKTKESYELTKHEGIRYFRDAFLFFGLSYAVRFLFGLTFLTGNATPPFFSHSPLMAFSILLLGYFSTMGILSLLFSVIWKHFRKRNLRLIGHSVAILLSLITFAVHSHHFLLALQCILLVVAAALSMMREKKFSNAKLLSLLVCGLWLINLLVIDRRRPFSLGIELLSEAVAIAVFLVIYRKITKWVR